MKKIIYADNAATTQLDEEAYEAMKPYLSSEYGNISQPYSFSRNSKLAIKKARETIADCIGAYPDEIYFTSGGTESNNWAIMGSAFSNYKKRATITTSIEHHSILNSCKTIEKLGYPVAYLNVTEEGIVLESSLRTIITENTKLVSIMMANNELGSIEPIKNLAEIAHSYGVCFHTDAVQAVGHIPINVHDLNIDMLSASAHKFNGPKGIGFLYIKNGITIDSYMNGGMQEHGLRAGTENVASIVGMAVALKNNCTNMTKNMQHIQMLEKQFLEELKSCNCVKFRINGAENKLPGLLSLSFNHEDGERILHRLDLMGIMISTGSACDSERIQSSHVLSAIGLSEDWAKGTIRISLGKNNSIEDIYQIITAINKYFE